jgi:hypothetical protein
MNKKTKTTDNKKTKTTDNKKTKTTDNKKTKTTDNKKTETTHGTRPGDGASTSDPDAREATRTTKPDGAAGAPTAITLALPLTPEALAKALHVHLMLAEAANLLREALAPVNKAIASHRRRCGGCLPWRGQNTQAGHGAGTSDRDARAVTGAPGPEGALTLSLPPTPEALVVALLPHLMLDEAADLLRKALEVIKRAIASHRRRTRKAVRDMGPLMDLVGIAYLTNKRV